MVLYQKESWMNKFVKFLGKNRPTILTFVGLGGLVATAVMAYKSAESVQVALDTAWNLKVSEDPEYDEPDLTKKEKAWVYVKTLWPTFTLGAASAALIILGNSDHLARRNAALTAYLISEGKLKDYQAEMVKEIGEKQAGKIRDQVNEKKLSEAPEPTSTVILSSDEPWLYDTATNCYFRMNYEKFRRIMVEAALEITRNDYISVAELYSLLDVELPPSGKNTSWWMIGWSARDLNSDGKLDYWPTSTITEIQGNKVPCMVIDYNPGPHHDFNMYG